MRDTYSKHHNFRMKRLKQGQGYRLTVQNGSVTDGCSGMTSQRCHLLRDVKNEPESATERSRGRVFQAMGTASIALLF